MADYGAITIDNKNLLNDLLGLEGNENQDLPIYKPRQQTNYNNTNNNYLPVEGRKILLESPTFTKKEDDIYRYVHSRISSIDTSLNAGPNFHDSLEHPDDHLHLKNTFVDNNEKM